MRHPQCRLFHPGHQVHHIQARKVAEVLHPASGELERFTAAELTDLGGGWFEADVGGETWLGWNHSLDDVAAFSRDSILGEVLFVPEYSALVCVRGQFDSVASQRRLLYPAWGRRQDCIPVSAVI